MFNRLNTSKYTPETIKKGARVVTAYYTLKDARSELEPEMCFRNNNEIAGLETHTQYIHFLWNQHYVQYSKPL